MVGRAASGLRLSNPAAEQLGCGLGLGVQQLAEKAGVRRATVSEIEGGTTTRIDLGVLERLANALDMDASLLIRHERKGTRG